jgi:hypothetical protein
MHAQSVDKWLVLQYRSASKGDGTCVALAARHTHIQRSARFPSMHHQNGVKCCVHVHSSAHATINFYCRIHKLLKIDTMQSTSALFTTSAVCRGGARRTCKVSRTVSRG